MRESPLYQEIVLEGKQDGKREDVLRVLKARFGPEAAREFTDAVNSIEDLEQLGELIELASKSRRVSQFRRALSTKTNGH